METAEGVQNSCADDRLKIFLKLVGTKIEASCVPVKLDGNVRPLEENDFKNSVPVVECNLIEISGYLIELTDLLRVVSVDVATLNNFRNEFVVPLILLCGEHRKHYPWTSENTISIVGQILQLLCKLCSCSELGNILLETSSFGGKRCGPLLKRSLLSLRLKLLNDTWKTFPAAVACYQWILFKVKAPYLSDYLSLVLPTALIIVDDFQIENQLLGISCLQHIVENVTRAELSWHGQGDVVFQALQRMLYEREPALVGPLVSCLLLVLDKLERGHLATDKDNSWCRFDDVLEIVLRNMEMESRSSMRKVYIDSLPRLLEAAGVVVVRWSKRILRVLQDYAEVAGQAEREAAVATLQALKTYMMLARPRLHQHATVILSMLLRLLYDVTVPTHIRDSSEEELVVKSVEDCLSLLAQNAPHKATKIAVDVTTQARFNKKFAAVIDSVFTQGLGSPVVSEQRDLGGS